MASFLFLSLSQPASTSQKAAKLRLQRLAEVEAAAPMPPAPAQAYAATAMPSPFMMQPQAAYTDPTTQIQYVEVPQHHRQNMAMAHAGAPQPVYLARMGPVLGEPAQMMTMPPQMVQPHHPAMMQAMPMTSAMGQPAMAMPANPWGGHHQPYSAPAPAAPMPMLQGVPATAMGQAMPITKPPIVSLPPQPPKEPYAHKVTIKEKLISAFLPSPMIKI